MLLILRIQNYCFIMLAYCLACGNGVTALDLSAKNNGDIYLSNETNRTERRIVTPATDEITKEPDINFGELMQVCNASFSIPIEYLMEFNSTGNLPDITDKTGMCHIRCMYEKSGLIDNWKLNADRIRRYIWPTSDDSIAQCEMEGKSEMNPCVHTYKIAQCLMLRAIIDAGNAAEAA